MKIKKKLILKLMLCTHLHLDKKISYIMVQEIGFIKENYESNMSMSLKRTKLMHSEPNSLQISERCSWLLKRDDVDVKCRT